MVKVLGLGDNVCDVYLHTGMMYPGGQALNFAVYAKALGAESEYLGVFGEDAVAAHIQSTLKEKGIGYSHSRSYPGENGFARVTLVEGDRVFRGSNKGGVLQQHLLELNAQDLAYLDGFDVVHTTNNSFLDRELPKLAPLTPLISYDFSGRWTEEDRIARVAPFVDFAFLSCSDLSEAETQALCRRLHDAGCGVVTATRGSLGALVFDGAQFFSQPPDLVQATDTMGAGDSFATAMLVSIAQQLEQEGRAAWGRPADRARILPPALANAAAFAAKTCLVSGAFGCGAPVPDSVRQRIYEEI